MDQSLRILTHIFVTSMKYSTDKKTFEEHTSAALKRKALSNESKSHILPSFVKYPKLELRAEATAIKLFFF